MKREFYRQVFDKKKRRYQVSSKFVQWEPSCSMRTDGHDKANSRFCNFVNAPKKRKEKTCILTDVAIPADRNVIQNEAQACDYYY